MKLQKLLIGAAALACGSALTAQSIHIGGYVDYTSTVATQVFDKCDSTDGWDGSEVASEFGPVQNGIHFLNLDATAPNVDFHVNTWIGSGLGPWYADVPEYTDRSFFTSGTDWSSDATHFSKTSDDASTPIGQMWLCTHFFNDQMRFYTGNFASNGWNAGYIFGGYVLGGQKIDSLAMRGTASDSAFSGIELQPSALTGFKMIAGLPVAPFTSSYSKFNDWSHLAKAVKVMAQYRWLLYNITFNGGVRPNTYFTNGKGYADDFTKSYFGEAFLQVDMPSLIYGFMMNMSYDIRWRKAEVDGDLTVSGEDWSKTTTAHIAQVSAKFTQLVPGWEFGIEDRFAYYAPHYITTNETAIFNILGLSATHPIPGTSFVFGFNAVFMYGQDANGQANGLNKPTNFDALCTDLVAFDYNFMGLDGEDKMAPKTGSAGRYYSIYGYPYIQKNFANGNAKLGLELQYKHLETSNVLQAIAWRVPLGLTFWW